MLGAVREASAGEKALEKAGKKRDRSDIGKMGRSLLLAPPRRNVFV
jgi:hypothetical protein